MIRKILFSISILSAGAMLAAPLTPEEALGRLDEEGIAGTRAAIRPQLVKTVTTEQGSPAVYVFNNEGEGFMVLSADDAITPVLGYSDTGRFDLTNPQLAYWLGEYSRQIDYAIQTGATSTRAGITLPNWSAIQPLVKSKWDQDAPYNLDCPYDKANGGISYTGCVATAMAQVMNYFKYPAKGQGENSYTSKELNEQLTLNFSNITFDWDNMLDSYLGGYNQKQAQAVATLMYACGVAVNMDYSRSTVGSGAVSNKITGGVVNYFNYDKGIRYYSRNDYTYTDWATMVYNNLKNVGPIIYNGTGAGGGHSWVCDGYDGNGYFHMNWGWGGMSDGYFLLNALEPGGIGIGGGLGAFNFLQGCVFNMQPPTSTPAEEQKDVMMYGSLQGKVSGSTLQLDLVDSDPAGWGIQSISDLYVQLGVGYFPADNPSAQPAYQANQKGSYTYLEPQSYIPASDKGQINVKIDLNQMNLQEGVKYKVVSAYRVKESQSQADGAWQQAKAEVGLYNYFYLTKTGNNKWTVENLSPMVFTGTSVDILTDLYFGSGVQVKVGLQNDNDTELTRTVALVLLNNKGRLQFQGGDNLVSISPDGSTEVVWNTALQNLTGSNTFPTAQTYYPGILDVQSNKIIYQSDKTVTMNPRPGSLTAEVAITVPDAATNENGYYLVEDSSNFQVESVVDVKRGYLADQLYLAIYEPMDNGYANGVMTYPLGDGFTYLKANETETFMTNVNFTAGEIDQLYYLDVLNSQLSAIDNKPLSVGFIVMGNSGVESIVSAAEAIVVLRLQGDSSVKVVGGQDGIASVAAYYLNGMQAPIHVSYMGGQAQVDLSDVAKGIIVLNIADGKGNTKAVKIAM